MEKPLFRASCPPPYGSAQAVQIAPGDLVRVVMPCPAPQKPHTPARPTAVSRIIVYGYCIKKLKI